MSRFYRLFLGCLLLFISLRAACQSDDALMRITRIAPSLPAKVLVAGEWKVFEWRLGAERQRERFAVEVATLIEVGRTYYVGEARTGRWLVGFTPKRGEKIIECDQQFKNLDALVEASGFAQLPEPPKGFRLREVVRLANHPTRLASDGQGKVLYVLCVQGDVWRVDLSDGALSQILWGDQYLDPSRGERLFVGMTLDHANRLYLVANQRVESITPVTNEVTVFRTTAVTDGNPTNPKPWLKTSYPWGIGPFNHGVGHIAFGPDGHLYVTSGSRTDGNEPGKDDRYAKVGETPLTANIWRLDPTADHPKIEIYASGLRNAYGFCWNDKGEMFATDNGPDADPPEELNQIERGKHYGFPYQFSNWTRKPYPHTPEPPAGVQFTPPIANLGPAGGFQGQPLYTFDPHSSPSGIVFLDDEFPPDYRGTFLIARFGNLLERPRDVGFDVLHARLRKNAQGVYEANMFSFLAPIARPVDLHLSGRGKVFICEYSRQVQNKGYSGMLPGRVLELAVVK